ncbi:MAG TPA: cell division protein ZapD, partial [Gammaproteobacteria bacterium]|nr:cell division protein ZapD [Gammaproteobacteria bacterium]
ERLTQNTPMADTASNVIRATTESNLMAFEQPLTERMRTFLRIEFLHAQADYHAKNLRGFGARAAVASLLEMMTILGRGDVRADVLKELERQATLLATYARQPDIDHERLDTLVGDVNGLKAAIARGGPTFMNPLKDCEFLSTIRHRSSIPGGTCVFDLPDYAYWLRLPHDERVLQFQRWIAVLEPICSAVTELLWLTRETNEPVERLAAEGLYQHQMDRTTQTNLARVIIPRNTGYYPEISAGRHRVTVRFVKWQGVDMRPAQVDRDIRFLLSLS